MNADVAAAEAAVEGGAEPGDRELAEHMQVSGRARASRARPAELASGLAARRCCCVCGIAPATPCKLLDGQPAPNGLHIRRRRRMHGARRMRRRGSRRRLRAAARSGR